MFWEIAAEILKNPVGFIITYFLTSLGGHIITVFVSSILFSIFVFPLTLLGKPLFERIKGGKFKKIVFTSTLMSLFVSILAVIWGIIFNPEYGGPFSAGILNTLIGLILLIVIISFGIEIGIWLSKKMEKHWAMPEKLKIYLAVFSSLFVILGLYMLYIYINLWIMGV